MDRARPIRLGVEFRSKSQKNHAIVHSPANRENSSLSVFKHLHTQIIPSPLFSCDCALRGEGGIPISNTFPFYSLCRYPPRKPCVLNCSCNLRGSDTDDRQHANGTFRQTEEPSCGKWPGECGHPPAPITRKSVRGTCSNQCFR